MMKKIFTLFFLIVLGLTSNLIAQAPELDLQIINRNIETVYLADIDVLQLASADEFFLIDIRFGNQPYTNCRLTLTFSKDDKLLARVVTKPFSIPAAGLDGSNKSASNVDFMQDKFYLTDTPNPDYLIEVAESNLSTDQIERDVLSSGKLPVGHYILQGILEGNEFVPQEDYDEFDITNPNFVQLIAPGTEAGSGFKDEVYNEFPVFQWNGNGSEYQVVVFEKKFALQSLDNILSMNPNC